MIKDKWREFSTLKINKMDIFKSNHVLINVYDRFKVIWPTLMISIKKTLYLRYFMYISWSELPMYKLYYTYTFSVRIIQAQHEKGVACMTATKLGGALSLYDSQVDCNAGHQTSINTIYDVTSICYFHWPQTTEIVIFYTTSLMRFS